MIDLALIEQCKNPNVDTNIIMQIIKIESDNKEFAININKIGKFVLETKKEASFLATAFINKGYSVDIGLMQFNSNNLNTKLFSSYNVDDLLEPCKNIKASSDLFYLAYESTSKNLDKNDRINKALSIYNTGNINKGFLNGYVKKYSSYKQSSLEQAKKSGTKVKLNYDINTTLFKKYNIKGEQK